MNKNLLIVLAFLLFNIGYGQKIWTGATSTAWETDSNWSPSGKPTAGENVLITNAANQPVINVAGASCAVLELSNSTSGSLVVLTVKSGSFSPSSITMNSNGGDTSDCSLKIGTGTVNVTGDVIMTGTALQNDVTFSGAGTLKMGGVMTGGTLNADGIGTVNYSAPSPRTIGTYTYNNLTLSGSGIKTIANSVIVNGTLIMAGTATASAAPTYGPNAGLQYNSLSAQTVGPEWVSPFIATGGVEISTSNPGVSIVTINGNGAQKKFNDGIPLIIDEDASLVVNNAEIYLGGDFINNRGFLSTDKFVYLTGGVNQSIDSFTSTEGIVMNKTAGIATFTGNINTKKLIINGLGTLNLGTGLTHTFTSDWTRTQGTLNASSSILKISGNVLGNGGTFNPGTGTVDFNGGAQNLGTGSIIYNNLTLSGSGTKTFGAQTTIKETFSIVSGVMADLTTNLVHTAKNIKLGVAGESGGSWGSSLSNAVNKNNTFFTSNNGIVNVGPTIVIDRNSIAALTTTYGTPSSSNSFTVSGTAMVGEILVTPPTGFEVSIDGVSFSNTLTIGTAAYIAATKVYVRLKGTIDVENYFGDVVLTSTGTTTIHIPIATSTVNKAPLTITAVSVGRTYGEANPAFTASYVGIIDGEKDTNLTKSAIFNTVAVATSSVGDYPITVSGVTSSNYTIKFVSGTLTINKAPLTITAVNVGKTYGEANPAFTASYVGIIDGETDINLTKSVTFNTAAIATSSVGDYPITVSGVTSLNYDIKFFPGKLTINKAILTITADKIKKTHGEANPAFTASYVGIIDGETDTNLLKSITFNTTATATSTIGEYPITVSGVISSNYDITFVNGILDVVASNNAGLSDIVISNGSLDQPFDTTDLGYTVVVKNEVDSYVINPKPSNPNATVVMTIDGKVIDPAAPFDLKVGENVIKIEVLAEDGITRNDYEVIVIREPSTDAGLADLTVSEGALSPAFDVDNKGYTVDVPNKTTSIVVIPTPKDPDAKVEMRIDGKTIDPTAPIDLKVGDNVVTVVVTAPDGTTQETYEVIVTREPSGNAGLIDLAISEGTLSPAFAEGTKDYTTTVPNETTSIKVTPVTADATATVTVNGIVVPSGTASPELPLQVGENEITTIVTAQDGTIQTYTVIVTREPSSNAGLTDLAISEGTLSPAFIEGTKDYTTTVPNETTSIKVTPVTADATATVTINGIVVPSGTASPELPLQVGENIITTVVTAQDGTIQTYTVIVTREEAPLSNDAGLTDLAISEGTLSPAFDTDIKGYTVDVPNATDSIVVTPTPKDPDAKVEMRIDGKTIDPTAPIDLKVGDNVVTVVVTAPDGTQEIYTVVVTRDEPTDKPSDNAGLADITVSDGDLDKPFNTDTKDYRVDVPNETNSIVITPTPIDPTAKVEMIVDGKTIDPSAPIDLKVGDNVITVVVTAEDGTQETYTVIVNRADAVPQAIIPSNIITPNGDGKNDYWIIDGLDKYPNNSVKVFDRAARLVYSKNNYNNDWDGTYKGSPVNEDTYYYLIDLGNGSPKIKGFISIIRN